MFFDHYPYTNFHNVNLDWVLQAVKAWGATVDANNQAFIDLKAANESFKEYVRTYLANLDVSNEINDKLDQMLADGILAPYMAPYIQTDVSAWLAQHITPTTPAVDSSLTISGAAADAKTTGDKLASKLELNTDNAETIPDNADFDNYVTVGTYKVTNNTHARTMINIPLAVAGKLIVIATSQTARLYQIYICSDDNAPTYRRYYDGANWKTWFRSATIAHIDMLRDRIDEVENTLSNQINNVEKSRKIRVRYQAWNYGAATERVNIYVPTISGYIIYRLYHYADDSNNCNGWQIHHAYHCDDDFDNEVDLTITGEWECAVKLSGRADFSGGHTHGDEVMNSIVWLLNGDPVDITTVLNTVELSDLRMIQTSTLYDPDDSVTEIADHGKEYIFNPDGLTINQAISWKVAEPLDNCFMAMFLPSKNYLDRAMANSDFKTVTLASSTGETFNSIVKPDANAVTMWDTSTVYSAEVQAPVYPKGLTGGDQVSFSDNGGNDYNKVYFKVCGGGSSTVGELWKTTTIYKLTAKQA